MSNRYRYQIEKESGECRNMSTVYGVVISCYRSDVIVWRCPEYLTLAMVIDYKRGGTSKLQVQSMLKLQLILLLQITKVGIVKILSGSSYPTRK